MHVVIIYHDFVRVVPQPGQVNTRIYFKGVYPSWHDPFL